MRCPYKPAAGFVAISGDRVDSDIPTPDDARMSFERAHGATSRADQTTVRRANLGIVLHAQGKLEEAAASYRRALSLRPNHADTLCNLGNTLQAQGKRDEAVSAYQQALRYRPDHAAAHCNLGNVLKAFGKLDEAAASYARAHSTIVPSQ